VGGLAAAEHDRDLHAVAVLEEADDVTLLGLVVVLSDLRAQLDLAHRHLLLVLAGLLRLLLLLVLVLRVVEDPDHGRARLGGHLDEVEVLRLRVPQRLVARHDADLLAVVADQPDLRHADPLVDARLIPLWRAPIEPTGDRH
jgi:hypothetical protein